MRLIKQLATLSSNGATIEMNPHKRASMAIAEYLTFRSYNVKMIDGDLLRNMELRDSLIIVTANPCKTILHYDLKTAVVDAIENIVFN